ncbi:MAG TPA: hypothetical protein VG273_27960 [Bryobacteraceae bacterium]|jgi:hypothetical protein|nr:hypothetical protein [Bryobacteraceae bacterium]
MHNHARFLLAAALAVAGFAGLAAAQKLPPDYIPQTKFNSGQDVVPSFDGWLRNPDGSFTMVFGYLNRNYKEELAIPAGPDNRVEPGGDLDRGQPTWFLPRRHAWVYQVKVPADWGQKELVWSITAHGRTEKAYATLQMEQEIIPRLIMSHGNLSPGLENPNKPPAISIAPVSAAAVGSPVQLMATVTDDGLPKPRAPKIVRAPEPGKPLSQSNSAEGRPRLGLNVSWSEYRGPAKVIFETGGPVLVSDGKAVTMARFSKAGTYVLRAAANDGELSTTADVVIEIP